VDKAADSAFPVAATSPAAFFDASVPVFRGRFLVGHQDKLRDNQSQ